MDKWGCNRGEAVATRSSEQGASLIEFDRWIGEIASWIEEGAGLIEGAGWIDQSAGWIVVGAD